MSLPTSALARCQGARSCFPWHFTGQCLQCNSNPCKRPLLPCNCNWPPCTWCSLLDKTKALSMSSPFQPGSTVSLSTSCEIGSQSDVVVKFSVPNPSCQKLRPKSCRSDTRGTVLRPDLWPFSRRPGNGLRSILPSLRRRLPYPGPELLKILRISSLRIPCDAYSASCNFVISSPCSERG